MNPNLLCAGCMKEVRSLDVPCPRCGYINREYQKTRSKRALPPYTILAGRYLIGIPLGEGGFGITYLAMDLKNEEVVAVKEFFPVGVVTRNTFVSDTDFSVRYVTGSKIDIKQVYRHGLESFANEANNMMRFRDLPGVVTVKKFFQQNSTAYLVMEFIDGMTLKQYLNKRRRPVSEDTVLKVMRPVLHALAQIHKSGFIHRDISPENIMLSKNGRVALIDFGAARVSTGTETQTMTIVLKRGYAPIEQYHTRGKQGPWTDIYGVCATMYAMLSGITPVESVERIQVDKLIPLKTLRQQNPEINVSSHTSDVISKGLAVYAQNRFQDARELFEALYGTRINDEVSRDSGRKNTEYTVANTDFNHSANHYRTDDTRYEENNETGYSEDYGYNSNRNSDNEWSSLFERYESLPTNEKVGATILIGIGILVVLILLGSIICGLMTPL